MLRLILVFCLTILFAQSVVYSAEPAKPPIPPKVVPDLLPSNQRWYALVALSHSTPLLTKKC